MTWPGKRQMKFCLIQPDSVKLSMTTVAFLSSTETRSLVRRAG